jgi:capsular polysaccharide biosynthesis protein
MENGLNFEKPLRLLRQARVRAGWNGAGMFAYIVPASQYPAIRLQKNIGEKETLSLSHIGLLNCSRRRSNLAPSGSDLAEDWSILD